MAKGFYIGVNKYELPRYNSGVSGGHDYRGYTFYSDFLFDSSTGIIELTGDTIVVPLDADATFDWGSLAGMCFSYNLTKNVYRIKSLKSYNEETSLVFWNIDIYRVTPIIEGAQKMDNGYIGIGDVARRINKVYIGDDNGVAQLVYQRPPAVKGNLLAQAIDSNGFKYGHTEIFPDAVNLLPTLTDADGNLYNGGKGYKTNTRLSSSGIEKT